MDVIIAALLTWKTAVADDSAWHVAIGDQRCFFGKKKKKKRPDYSVSLGRSGQCDVKFWK